MFKFGKTVLTPSERSIALSLEDEKFAAFERYIADIRRKTPFLANCGKSTGNRYPLPEVGANLKKFPLKKDACETYLVGVYQDSHRVLIEKVGISESYDLFYSEEIYPNKHCHTAVFTSKDSIEVTTGYVSVQENPKTLYASEFFNITQLYSKNPNIKTLGWGDTVERGTFAEDWNLRTMLHCLDFMDERLDRNLEEFSVQAPFIN